VTPFCGAYLLAFGIVVIAPGVVAGDAAGTVVPVVPDVVIPGVVVAVVPPV
jgi:hypothetical protein